jgi:hypothetical protein
MRAFVRVGKRQTPVADYVSLRVGEHTGPAIENLADGRNRDTRLLS